MPKERKDFDELDVVAEQMFDYSCEQRHLKDLLEKAKGRPLVEKPNPRAVACKYEDLTFEEQFAFWRNLAKWHLTNK